MRPEHRPVLSTGFGPKRLGRIPLGGIPLGRMRLGGIPFGGIPLGGISLASGRSQAARRRTLLRLKEPG